MTTDVLDPVLILAVWAVVAGLIGWTSSAWRDRYGGQGRAAALALAGLGAVTTAVLAGGSLGDPHAAAPAGGLLTVRGDHVTATRTGDRISVTSSGWKANSAVFTSICDGSSLPKAAVSTAEVITWAEASCDLGHAIERQAGDDGRIRSEVQLGEAQACSMDCIVVLVDSDRLTDFRAIPTPD